MNLIKPQVLVILVLLPILPQNDINVSFLEISPNSVSPTSSLGELETLNWGIGDNWTITHTNFVNDSIEQYVQDYNITRKVVDIANETDYWGDLKNTIYVNSTVNTTVTQGDLEVHIFRETFEKMDSKIHEVIMSEVQVNSTSVNTTDLSEDLMSSHIISHYRFNFSECLFPLQNHAEIHNNLTITSKFEIYDDSGLFEHEGVANYWQNWLMENSSTMEWDGIELEIWKIEINYTVGSMCFHETRKFSPLLGLNVFVNQSVYMDSSMDQEYLAMKTIETLGEVHCQEFTEYIQAMNEGEPEPDDDGDDDSNDSTSDDSDDTDDSDDDSAADDSDDTDDSDDDSATDDSDNDNSEDNGSILDKIPGFPLVNVVGCILLVSIGIMAKKRADFRSKV